MTNLGTWLHDNCDEYRFEVYVNKRIYTPYEIEKKFMDEFTEELMLDGVCIVEMIELPDKDVLLGFKYEDYERIYYYKLSDIRLVKISDKELIGDDDHE